MTELSRPWAGITTGDAGPYTDQHWSDIWEAMFGRKSANMGVLKNVPSELIVTNTSSPVGVAAGAAIVNGTWYESTAGESITVPTPGASTRIDRIVLRKSWAAQTVRLTRIAGVEGGAAPALVQVDGTTWDIPLANVSITTGGVITVIDTREFCSNSNVMDINAILTPASIGASQNDWNPSGYTPTINVIRIAASVALNLTGLAGGSTGRIMLLVNTSAVTITLVDESGSSIAANRFALLGNYQLEPDAVVWLWWDTTSQRWRLMAQRTVGIPTLIAKTSDQTTASVTLADVTELLKSMLANETWDLVFYLHLINNNSNIGFKFALTVPAGATMEFAGHWSIGLAQGYAAGETPTSGTAIAAGTTAGGLNTGFGVFHARVINGVNAGNAQLQFAGNSAGGNPSGIGAGSRLVATRES